MSGVSVAMAISRAHPQLGRAVRCLLDQEMGTDALEILLIVNGADAGALEAARRFEASDNRVRVLERERASLAGALNLGLRSARFDLVARMDDDDWCPPDRLRVQAEHMRAHPRLCGLGCAWELEAPDGTQQTLHPPTDPGSLRARLLLGNCLAHGSMMLRRDRVLAHGGYDESLDRAQDYELWLRLSRDLELACVDRVLYRYCAPVHSACSDEAQARAAARAMLSAWRNLEGRENDELAEAVAMALLGGASALEARDAIEDSLRGSPSREGLLASLWLDWAHPPMQRRALEVCRRARLREVGAMLRSRSISGVWVWGVGNHASWVLAHAHDLGIEILGVVDDERGGERFRGMTIESPDQLADGDAVLIASDAHEDAIWERSESLRERGVEVARLYDEDRATVSL